MSFVFPILLGGLLLAGVPIVLHLLVRQKPRLLPFPAFRFLVQKQRQTQRRLRLRHVLLLLLRVLLLAGLCLALARPRLLHEGLSIRSERPLAVVFVFDTSASMDYRVGERSRLDEAKARGRELLDRLPAESQLLVLDTGDPPDAAPDGWLTSPAAARQRIARLKIRPANAPVTFALERAYRRLAELARTRDEAQMPQRARLLAVFADRTRGSWDASQLPRLFDAADTVPPSYEGLVALRPRLSALEELLRALPERLPADTQTTGDRVLLDAVTKLKEELRTLVPHDLPPNELFAAAINRVRRLARELLPRVEHVGDDDPHKEFRERLRSALRDAVRDLAGAQSLFFDVGVEQPIDLALVQLDLPRDSTGQPQQTFGDGEPIRLQATIQAVGQGLSNALVWQVGERKEALPFELKAGESRTVPLVLDPSAWKLEAGPHALTVGFETTADALPFNNRRFLTFAMRARQKVLVLADDPGRAEPLAAALDTLGYAVTVDKDATAETLANHAAVYLDGVAAPSVALWQRLHAYVARGGGVAVVPPRDDGDLPAYGSPAALALLPAALGKKVDAGDAGRTWDWDRTAPGHPLMKPFLAWKDNTRIDFIRYPRTARFFRSVEPNDAAVLVAYAGKDHAPALLERRHPEKDGAGRVLLFTTPLDLRAPAWNNYADSLTSFYLALVMQSTRYLAGELGSAPLNFTLGKETPTVALPAAPRFAHYRLVGPETLERVNVGVSAQVAFKELTAPGNYALEGFDADPKQRRVIARFSLNVPSEESDLTRVPAAEVEAMLGPDCLVAVAQGVDLNALLQGHWSEPAELLPWLMLLILVALALENWLANRFYRQPAAELAEGGQP